MLSMLIDREGPETIQVAAQIYQYSLLERQVPIGAMTKRITPSQVPLSIKW